MNEPVRSVAVVIPVHDEEAHLSACLRSVLVAAARAPVPSMVVAVLDACTDASGDVAMHLLGPGNVVEIDERNVGRARRHGVAHALRILELPAAQVWVATTDADSLVPPTWLADQVTLADGGADAVAGTVEVIDWAEHPEGAPARFVRAYEGPMCLDDHTHVHGANLGVRASAYEAVGGFPGLASGEDHALWGALRRAGHALVATRRLPVVTSARRIARAPDGFAATLARLVDA